MIARPFASWIFLPMRRSQRAACSVSEQALSSRHNANRSRPAPQASTERKPGNLAGIRHVLAVASGKGGVGKSSVAVNLAYLLQSRGDKVGILDADIYGPSLPVLLPVQVKAIYQTKSGGIAPVVHEDVRMMSMGWARPGEHAAVRGPIVTAMVQQLLTQTEWGELDYLVIDMPPGTGDIHLTVAQNAHVSAAIVISTPQALALADVEKGIKMFNTVSIPTLAVVENMSTFVCSSCSAEHALFARPGGARQIAERFGVPRFVQLPLDPELSGGGGEGGALTSGGNRGGVVEPFVLDPRRRGRPLGSRLEELAEIVVQELAALRTTRRVVTSVEGTDGRALLEIFVSSSDGEALRYVAARDVRLACRSATMWDEFTGEKRFREQDIPLDVKPTKIEPAGGYAVSIQWSDGHRSLMPYEALERISAISPTVPTTTAPAT